MSSFFYAFSTTFFPLPREWVSGPCLGGRSSGPQKIGGQGSILFTGRGAGAGGAPANLWEGFRDRGESFFREHHDAGDLISVPLGHFVRWLHGGKQLILRISDRGAGVAVLIRRRRVLLRISPSHYFPAGAEEFASPNGWPSRPVKSFCSLHLAAFPVSRNSLPPTVRFGRQIRGTCRRKWVRQRHMTTN